MYRRLRERSYQVFAVNPNAETVEGNPSYHDLASIPDEIEAVVIGIRPETAEATSIDDGDLNGNVPKRVCLDPASRVRRRGDASRLPVLHE